MSAALVPHGLAAKGIDMCGGSNQAWIIRSDLHCVLTSISSKLEAPPSESGTQRYIVYPLHPACSGGDHYIKKEAGSFVIIKGKYFATVEDLWSPENSIEWNEMSSLCQGGDHYMYTATAKFVIVKGNTFFMVPDLYSTTTNAHHLLQNDMSNGLYYYGLGDNFYAIHELAKDSINLGTVYTKTDSLFKEGTDYFVFPDLLNFLPGGISTSFGSASPRWELLKTFTNSSGTALQWSQEVSQTVGYNKSQFEKNWEVSAEVSISTSFSGGFLVQAAVEAQFSLSTTFGGASIQSNQQDWSEEHTVTESLAVEVGAGKSVYIWQYRLGFSGSATAVLYCRDVGITDSDIPPSMIPLPTLVA